MFDMFWSKDFDTEVLLVCDNTSYTVYEVKNLVAQKAKTFDKTKQVILSADDNFDFIISFFAAVFSGKEIFLSDKNAVYDIESTTCDEVFDFKKIDLENVFVNFLTSGTSGHSKIVRKSLFNLIREAQDIGKTFFVDASELRFCSTTSLNHLFGFTFHFMTPFINGFIIDTNSVKYPENVKYENSVLISSPSFLSKMVKYNLDFEKTPKYIFAAGAKLEDNVFEYFEKKSAIIEIYGSTETGIVAHREHSTQKFLKLFDNVLPLKYENKILTVKSDYFSENYIELSDFTDFKGGNELAVITRVDRILKILEKRISAEKIEEYLKNSDLVFDVYCLKIGEKLGAAVVLSEIGKNFYIKYGQNDLIKKLKAFCGEKFEIIPQKWRFLPEIYKTPVGKIDREKIERIFTINLSFPLILEERVNTNIVEVDMIFPEHSNFFKGHFPKFPILPGVVSLYFVTFFANEFFKTELSPQIIRKIKFSQLIFPNKKVTLRLKNSEKSVDFEIFSHQNNFVSGIVSKEKLYE